MEKTAPFIKGLSEEEVNDRVLQGLTNICIPRATRSYSKIILVNVFSFYNLLLMSFITLLILLNGDRGIFFSTFLLFLNICLGLVQEIRAKIMLDKLSLLTKKLITVRRNGKNTQIKIDDIAQDDVIILQPGDAVVVDGPLLFSSGMEIDESSLTGESKYVIKNEKDYLYSGSYCVAGSGIMKAEKIGEKSSLNELNQSARAYKSVRTPLEDRLAKLLRMIIITIAVFGPLMIIAGFNVKLSVSESVENIVNLLFSLLPQGLITSVALLFAMGAIRISKSHAIVQRMNAIESMGHVKIMCMDKTGTLTKNALRLYDIVVLHESLEAVKNKVALFAYNITAPNHTISALLNNLKTSSIIDKVVSEASFKSERKWSGLTFKSKGTFILAAPELFEKNDSIQKKALEFAENGYRVLVFAQTSERLLAKQEILPKKLVPLALLVFSDEVRSDVVQTLQYFADLGIDIKIISGDHAETVRAIAQQAGIQHRSCLTEDELGQMKNHYFEKAVHNTTLFARITPDMKRKIIHSLMHQGYYTAMVGDGVNDVLALKKSDVSIAVNSGAQIAKDVSDIILLDNAFSTLPKAIEEGRDIILRVYAIAKIFCVKVIYFMTLFFLVGFANLPFPINLRQTTLLGFIITGIPILFITFKFLQPEKKEHPSKDFFVFSLLAGIIGGLAMTYLTAITVTVFRQDIEFSRTLVTIFASLYSSVVLLNIVGISLFDFQSIRKHLDAFIIILILTIDTLFLPIFFFPGLFQLVQIQIYDWLILIVLTLTCSYLLTFYSDKISFRKVWQLMHDY